MIYSRLPLKKHTEPRESRGFISRAILPLRIATAAAAIAKKKENNFFIVRVAPSQ